MYILEREIEIIAFSLHFHLGETIKMPNAPPKAHARGFCCFMSQRLIVFLMSQRSEIYLAGRLHTLASKEKTSSERGKMIEFSVNNSSYNNEKVGLKRFSVCFF